MLRYVCDRGDVSVTSYVATLAVCQVCPNLLDFGSQALSHIPCVQSSRIWEFPTAFYALVVMGFMVHGAIYT